MRILHDRQAPDGTVETPEDRQLKQQPSQRIAHASMGLASYWPMQTRLAHLA